MTKVLLLSNGITPDHLGGLQRYVRELAGALVRAGADVTVVARRKDPNLPLCELAEDGVTIQRFAGPSKASRAYALTYPLGAGRAALAAVDAHPDHLVHTHFPLQAFPLLLKRRRPFVHTFHAPVYREIESERQGSYALPRPLERVVVAASRRGERAMVRRATAIITLSAFMRDEVAALDAPAGARVTQVPGGIDTTRFTPDGSAVEHPWATGDGPLLFTARRLVPRTGVGELVEAMPEILTQVPGARLVIAGAGALAGRIAARVDALGLRERVLLAGRVSDGDLLGWYRAADLVVIPTQELEGFGLATAEALACGTPVVATPAGANGELLTPLSPRLVADGTAPADIARAVIAVLADPALLAAVAARARAHVHPAMSWDALAARHLRLYAQLAAA
ncbi:MAG TPA: glycosyltransferase family 4 protein [Baekduia sp.]|nr:glycosyltransferase family 4 protein [Baekduia sp.]